MTWRPPWLPQHRAPSSSMGEWSSDVLDDAADLAASDDEEDLAEDEREEDE